MATNPFPQFDQISGTDPSWPNPAAMMAYLLMRAKKQKKRGEKVTTQPRGLPMPGDQTVNAQGIQVPNFPRGTPVAPGPLGGMRRR